MSEPARSPVSPGDVIAGKYRIERVLGSGGMGVVVAATHLDLEQPVALKFILPQALAGKGNVERFMREARAAVRLKSEHVAKVFDVGRDGEDRPFMVLELLEGMDLAKLTKQKGSPPVADAVEYVLQASEALVEAHSAGIVHRDLKPQNLFVTRRLNGTPLVKVLDFGISKAIGPGAEGQMSLTDSAAVIGSPLYMAPEQMRSARKAETRSDIWALGVILYELLGGQLPFEGETVTEVCIRVVNDAPMALLELRPSLDPALVAIVMKCLEKEPNARFHNVAALAAALEPFSRSAKQGGLVRPWRSFEDTQDSRDGDGTKKNAFAAVDSSADDTGPSSIVTMNPVIRDDAIPKDPPLVSTDVAWGESSRPRPAKGRGITTGLVAAIVVLVAGVGVAAGVMLGRAEREAPKASASEGPIASASPIASADVEADAGPAPVVSAAPPASASAAALGRLLGKHPRVNASPRPAEKPSPSAKPDAPKIEPPNATSEPVNPNGAPILR
ncbi:MAG: serine/threonine protein kinase [Labilithrix sp.]|nr:serine/threonine protein kinase [Labilithrix sp.]